MNKKYLMKGMAALALIASVSSCVSDVEGISQADIDAAAKENAELQLGITIPEGQTWSMAAKVTTDITVNLGVDQNYTVGIYDGDPLHNSKAKFYALEEVSEGGSLNTSITLPIASEYVYVTVYDSKLNIQAVQAVPVVDGKIEANVGGMTGNRAMRAAFNQYWDGVHSSASTSKVPCGVYWTDTIPFKNIPSGLVTVTSTTKISPDKNYYVPATFNGKLKFNDNFNGSIYVAGKVTGYEGGNQGTMSVYIFEKGSWTGGFTTGTQTFYNNGELNLGGSDLQNSNIAAIYNAGAFTYGGSNTNSSTYFYSTGTVELTASYVDFKLKCDVHNTIKAKGGVKIQNGTAKYICGIETTGKVENVDGPLVTSNIIAGEVQFDGNPIYLTQGGHIKATNTITLPNSNCHVYAVAGSTALVETTNFVFGNKNDLTHTFSDNIYFKVSGYVNISNCYAMGDGHYFGTVAEYLAYNGHNPSQSDEYALAITRVNAGTASGSPACGDAWSMTQDPGIKGEQIIYTYAFEDQKVAGDYDMNDVVLKICHPYNADGKTLNKSKLDVKLVAAGATFNIRVKIGDQPLFNGEEIHKVLGVNPGVMVNTGAHSNVQNGVTPKEFSVDAPAGWDGDFEKLDVKIEVITLDDEVIAFLTEKVVPYAVMIPNDWEWPIERINVMKAYKGFKEWAETPVEQRTPEMNRWYENPVEGNVVTNLSNNQ